MMKYKERDINKRVTIQQYPQQTSTKNFACQKRKRLRTAFLIFFSLFFESSSTKSTKSTIECIIVKPNLNDIRMKKIELIQSIKQQDPILANAVCLWGNAERFLNDLDIFTDAGTVRDSKQIIG